MNMKSLSRSNARHADVLVKMVELLTFTLGSEEYAFDFRPRPLA